MEKFKATVRSLAAQLNLNVESIASHGLAHAKAIGALGALNVFSHYIQHCQDLCADQELASFMSFYAEKWRSSRSQYSQDIFVMFITNCKQAGSFLEIGGADGITHSNTIALEKTFGWSGVLVEPDPSQFCQISKFRVGNTLINAAISPDGNYGERKLRQIGQISALEGFEGKDYHYSRRMTSSRFIRVKTISINQLLSENHFDYFSLDVEGAELQILNSVKWSSINKPRVMTIEHNGRHSDLSSLRELLIDIGYQEHFESHDWLRGCDLWMTLCE